MSKLPKDRAITTLPKPKVSHFHTMFGLQNTAHTYTITSTLLGKYSTGSAYDGSLRTFKCTIADNIYINLSYIDEK